MVLDNSINSGLRRQGNMGKQPVIIFITLIFFISSVKAQQRTDSVFTNATLNECVQYALSHQPVLQQSIINQQIVNAAIKTRLSDWYPQLNLNYNLQHYFQTPQFSATGFSVQNLSSVNLGLTQNIFNPDVLLASKTAGNVRLQTSQVTENNKIYLVLNVSKAFYDVLLSQKQIDLVDQDILRLSTSLKDAYNQYQAGVVDKTDYKRAQISLNNARASKKQFSEALNAKFSTLKLLMGYPQQDSFKLIYDSIQLQKEIYLDTLQEVNYSNRVEYKILETQRSLLQANIKYYKWSYLPSLSANASYNLAFANDDFSKLYAHDFPSSYAGLTMSFPIFQGGKRSWQIRGANLQLDRLNYNFISLRDSIQSEFIQSLAAYKSYLNDYNTQHENLDLANDVYNTIYLQYKAGIKTYLDVIIAESDLRTTQVNYLNALYQVLSSKLDVEKALGTLTY